MNILFYVHHCRDRDFWPIARSVVNAGHPVYYALAEDVPFDPIIAADQRLAFDLVVSCDRVTRRRDGARLNMMLVKKPALVEVVVNDLLEVVMDVGKGDGSFSNLEQDRVCVGVLDPCLLETSRAAGVPSVACLPYGVLPHQITEAAYFVRRRGKRVFGEIYPDDLTAIRPVDWFRARREHASEGYVSRRRSTDVVFLGECRLGPDTTFLHYVATNFFRPVTGEALVASDARIRQELAIGTSSHPPALAAVGPALRHLPLDPQGRLARIGFLLMKDHYEQKVRVARRLALVRRLIAVLGSRFELYGDHFIEHGLPARPTDHYSNEQKYLQSKISVDFGSHSYDCSLDHRPSRIISCGSLLLQFRRPDAGAWFGGLMPRMTFENGDEMIASIDHYLSSPSAAVSTTRAQRALAAKACGMDAIVNEFLATKPWSSALPGHES
jgi:hypothetical protein